MIKRAADSYIGISNLLKPGAMKGNECGFIPILNDHYTCRLKQTTIITGYPSSGKSFFAMNLQAALTSKYNWKHILYTPEMGNADEIFLTLAEIITGMSVGYGLTEKMIDRVLPYISDHFFVYEPEAAPTMHDLTKFMSESKREYGFHTFSIDNLNDLRHNIVGTQDIYFEDQLLTFNNCAKYNDIHGFLLAHPAKPQPDDMNTPPAPDKIKGGSAFWSKGQTILSLRDSDPYLEVTIYKAKPRYVAKKGNFLLNKEYKRSTYSHYSGTAGGQKVFLFPQEGHAEVKQPALSFQEPKTDSYENPSF